MRVKFIMNDPVSPLLQTTHQAHTPLHVRRPVFFLSVFLVVALFFCLGFTYSNLAAITFPTCQFVVLCYVVLYDGDVGSLAGVGYICVCVLRGSVCIECSYMPMR